jgi:hypothetical protein
MRIVLVLAIAVGVACAALWIQLRPDTDVAAPREASAPAQPPAPVVFRPTPRAPLPVAPDLPEPAEPDEVEPAPPVTDEEQAAAQAERRARRALLRDRIGAAMASQSRDPSWADAVEHDVRSSMQKAADTAVLQSVECRQSLCALVMTHAHPDAQREAMQALAGAPGFRMAGRAHLEYDRSRGAVTYVYLSRASERFPSF